MKNKEKIIVIIGIVAIVLIWFVIPLVRDLNREKRLNNDGVYTVGRVENVVDDHHASPSVKYKFVYKGLEYEDFTPVGLYDESLMSQRFFVVFLPDYPSTSKILLDKPVPSNIHKIPSLGWQELPD